MILFFDALYILIGIVMIFGGIIFDKENSVIIFLIIVSTKIIILNEEETQTKLDELIIMQAEKYNAK